MSGLFDWLWKAPAEKASVPTAPPSGVDLYLLLGVSPDATSDEVRSAYRKLAAQFHPDRNPNDPDAIAKFHAIGKAHDILANPDARRAYDRTRRVAGPQKPMYPAPIIVSEEGPSKQAKVPPKKSSAPSKSKAPMWEAMFGPSREEEEREGDWSTAFAPDKTRRGAPIHEGIFGKRPIDMPDEGDVEKVISTFPLDWIGEVARHERFSPEFRRAGGVVIDAIAGTSGFVESDLSDLFGLDFNELDEYVKRYGREALWQDVLNPFLKFAGEVFTKMKPKDLPGFFAFDWDESGRVIELLYGEDTKRPWR